jgi:hypothetical protein
MIQRGSVKTPIIGFIDDWFSKLQSPVNPVPSLNVVSRGQSDNLQTFDISSKIETHKHVSLKFMQFKSHIKCIIDYNL